MAIFARSPKPAFSEKVQRGDLGKFLKNCPESSPHWKGPTALWRKWHYPLICMLLKCKDRTRFSMKPRLQKCRNGQLIAYFARSPKAPHFLKKCKGGTEGNFSKIAQKVSFVLKTQKHSGANAIIL